MVLASRKRVIFTDEDYKAVGLLQSCAQSRMKAFRKANGLTFDDVARMFEPKGNTSTWRRIESGTDSIPSLSTLVKIACIMGISVSELLSPLENEK